MNYSIFFHTVQLQNKSKKNVTNVTRLLQPNLQKLNLYSIGDREWKCRQLNPWMDRSPWNVCFAFLKLKSIALFEGDLS